MRWKIIRDITMFMMGAGAFVHETLVERADRPTLLLASLALMGVPFFMRQDEGSGK